ncbi:MAG: DNA-3-methyladenine glycosylase [Clostridiales bacterium]|nr:DNA-3-methyladenine glycosylase [Clostridiales bacterium]
MKKLNKAFYTRDTLTVAKELLGKYLAVNNDEEKMIVKIVETEAYIGPIDKACHTYNNRRTKRTEIMYSSGGYAYIYQIYGMYFCLNVVTENEDAGTAVLIRAGEPIKGVERMAVNRFSKKLNELSKKEILNLTNGPGKLCRALGLDKRQNGSSLLGKELFIFAEDVEEPFQIALSKRIGIDYAEEARDYEWRFYIKDNPYVSVKTNK